MRQQVTCDHRLDQLSPMYMRSDANRAGIASNGTAIRIYEDDEREFMTALERYKRENHRPFPTCCDVLAVLKSIGYRKVDCAAAQRPGERDPG